MPRLCSVCTHAQRAAIEQQLADRAAAYRTLLARQAHDAV